MIAKFVAHGADRDDARQRLGRGLRAAQVLGVRTNQAFLAAALAHETFVAGEATTGFVGRHLPALLAESQAMRPTLAALVAYCARAARHGHDPRALALPMPWPVNLKLVIDDIEAAVALQALGGARYRLSCDGTVEEFELLEWAAGLGRVSGGSGRESIAFALEGDHLYASSAGVQTIITDRSLAAAAAADSASAGLMRAPMAGRIVALFVSAGQRVEKGAPLFTLEAMKMEHPSTAPMDAIVKQVLIEHGAQVSAGALLVELQAAP